MFRRLPNRLPPDLTFPTDLQQLGYFINENDQIRQVAHPDQKYQYRINRNERVNDVYKEAMNTCTRKVVLERLHELGMEELRLPLGASTNDKHIPILVSPNLASRKHVIVYFGERHNDLGILAYRVIGNEGVNMGSMVNFVRSVLEGSQASSKPTDDESEAEAQVEPEADRSGVILANTSQLLWYRGGARAVTDREWMYLGRESAVYDAMRIDEEKNRVDGNKDFKEHIQYIFEHILFPTAGGRRICHPEVKISIVGQEYPGSEALQYVANHWLTWRNRISCVALINPQHSLKELFSTYDFTKPGDITAWDEVTDFVSKRTRAYRLHQKPLETLVHGRTRLGCNVYSAGEKLYEESCFVRCWPSVLDWISLCRFSETYAEPPLDVEVSDNEEETEKPKVRSPRKAQTEEQAQVARLHGEWEMSTSDTDAKKA